MSVQDAPGVSVSGGDRDIADAMVLVVRESTGVAIVTLNRPRQRNSLSMGLMGDLLVTFQDLSADDNVRSIVLAASGPAFCAGHDLKELTAHRSDPDGGQAYFKQTMARCVALMQQIVDCPKPVVAAVEGIATAAGCQLVATCDLAVAGENAQFCTPGVDIGLFCSTPMVALARNVPRKRAMEMLLLGDMVPAPDAAAYGLVNRVVGAGTALDESLTLARRIAAKSPLAMALGKRAFYRQIEAPLQAAYQDAAAVMVENMLAADSAEGIGAFLEKRSPVWTGR